MEFTKTEKPHQGLSLPADWGQCLRALLNFRQGFPILDFILTSQIEA